MNVIYTSVALVLMESLSKDTNENGNATAVMSCTLDMGMRDTQTMAALCEVGKRCSLEGKMLMVKKIIF